LILIHRMILPYCSASAWPEINRLVKPLYYISTFRPLLLPFFGYICDHTNMIEYRIPIVWSEFAGNLLPGA